MTRYGSAQLTNAKFYATAGMESLRSMLKHANQYGLKYVFVHGPYHEPLLRSRLAKNRDLRQRRNYRLVKRRCSSCSPD